VSAVKVTVTGSDSDQPNPSRARNGRTSDIRPELNNNNVNKLLWSDRTRRAWRVFRCSDDDDDCQNDIQSVGGGVTRVIPITIPKTTTTTTTTRVRRTPQTLWTPDIEHTRARTRDWRDSATVVRATHRTRRAGSVR